MRSGLQQSYGDHNRLLLLGLDRLLEGDLEWYRTRLERPAAVDDAQLTACLDSVRELGLGASELIALWTGAALHDCGMLTGQAPRVDVEDGVEIARDVINALCPSHVRPLAFFAVRNHDYVKDVFRGEVPVRFLVDQLEALAPELRPIAVVVLGMIQVAGAASLGEGRLSAFRVSIFERCAAGTVFDDPSSTTRLARMLAPGLDSTDPPDPAAAYEVLATVGERRRAWTRFLEAVPVHRWHRAWDGYDSRSVTAGKVDLLDNLVDLWEHLRVDHIVLMPDADNLADGTIERPLNPHLERKLNGTVAAVVC
jgi:hypothetical protein